jgi:hypothetical protein
MLEFLFRTPEFKKKIDYFERDQLIVRIFPDFNHFPAVHGENLYCRILVDLFNNGRLLDRLIDHKKQEGKKRRKNRTPDRFKREYYETEEFNLLYNISYLSIRIIGHIRVDERDRDVLTEIHDRYRGENYTSANKQFRRESPIVHNFAHLLWIWISAFWHHGYNILEFLPLTMSYTDMLFTEKHIIQAIKFSEEKLHISDHKLMENWDLVSELLKDRRLN